MATGDTLTALTIVEAAEALRRRRCSAVELTRAYLRRIDAHNPAVNAYLTVTRERALAEAQRADHELSNGHDRGPLHGIPIAVKDSFDTAGVRTTGGARVFDDRVPSVDARAVQRLSEAGAVLLGKLNMDELAVGVMNVNPHYGPVRNPWRSSHSSGGSSGGSAAAVTAHLAAAALATDTLGSVRIPASHCGAVGLMPTFGRVTKAGVLPMFVGFDHVGPITRTVTDAALMLAALAGPDEHDETSAREQVPDFAAELEGGARGLRLGVPRPHFYELLHPEVAAAVEAALRVLTEAGATSVELSTERPQPLVEAERLCSRREFQRRYGPTRAEHGPLLRRVLSLPLPDERSEDNAARLLSDARRAVLGLFDRVDVLVLPTTPVAALPLTGNIEDLPSSISPDDIGNYVPRCCAVWNALKFPALTLPCGFTRDGRPVGLQLVGKPFAEATLLRAARAYEQLTDWHRRRPAMSEAQ